MSPLNLKIELKNVSKIYYAKASQLAFSILGGWIKSESAKPVAKSKLAVNKISLHIEDGQRVGIVGRNGAGKSTLLHLIAGLSEISSGQLNVVGRVTSIMTLGVGLREDLSGRENIYIDGEIQGKTREEINLVIDSIIEFADLGEFIDYPIRTYSTGMKARLAFSMITSIEPEILIIDEALSTGDSKFAVKAGQKIRDICSKGKIVILVSHSMASIVEMCDRCLWIDNGKILADGDPRDVTAAYIEAIKKEEEVALVEKFKSYLSNRSFVPGYSVEAIHLSYDQENEAKYILEPGRDVKMAAKINMAQLPSSPDLQFKITRTDGLVLIDSLASQASPLLIYQAGQTSMPVEVFLQPLRLGLGIYELSLTLLDGKTPLAARSTIFEVASSNVPKGGRPALTYPCDISVLARDNERDI